MPNGKRKSALEVLNELSPPVHRQLSVLERLNQERLEAIEITEPPSVLGEFISGVGTGFLTPFEIFKGGAEEEVDSPAHPIARTFGELGGVLVSFVPIFKGSQLALKGIGVTKALTNFPKLSRILEGSLAFGAFEAGAGELEGVAERFTKGALIGAGAEAAILGIFPNVARASRGGASRGRRVSAQQIAKERAASPGSALSEDEFVVRVLELAEGDEAALEKSISKVADAFKPGGVAILTNVQNPATLIKNLNKGLGREVRFASRRSDIGEGWEVLMTDSVSRSRLVSRMLQNEDPKIKFLGLSGELSLSYEDAVRLVEMDLPSEKGIRVFTNLTEVDVGQATGGKFGERVLGFFREGGPLIAVAREATDAHKFSTLVHEYTHALTAWVARRRGLPKEELIGLRDVFDLISPAEAAKLGAEGKRFVDVFVRSENLYTELADATMAVIRKTLKVSAKDARDVFLNDVDYYTKPSELMARMAELLFLDPKLAKKIAPRASRLMSRLILRESPKLKMLLSKGELRNLDDWFNKILSKEAVERRVFEDVKIGLNSTQVKQWVEEGGFLRMEAYLEGRPVEWIRRSKDGSKVVVRDQATGRVLTTDFSRVQRPVLPRLVEHNEELLGKVENILKNPPAWVGVTLRASINEPPDKMVRALVNLDNYQIIKGGSSGLERFIKAQGYQDSSSTLERAAAKAARELGKDGILVEDSGVYYAVVGNERSVLADNKVVFEGLNPDLTSGFLRDDFVSFPFNSVAKSLLREGGVPEQYLDHFVKIAREKFGVGIADLVDPEVKDAYGKALRAFDEIFGEADDVVTAASRANFKARETGPDSYRFVDPDTNVELFRGSSAEAREFAAKAGVEHTDDLLSASKVPSEALAASHSGGPPPRFQGQLSSPLPEERPGFFQRIWDFSTLFAPMLSGMEVFSKAAERAGHGSAWSGVFELAQRARKAVHRELGAVPRELLKGKTFRQQFEDIQTIAARVATDRLPLVSGWVEALTRQEIEKAGGLLQRAMTKEELDIARMIEKVGLEHDIPRLLATRRLARNLVKNKKTFLKNAERMLGRELSPETRESVLRLVELAEGTPDDLFKVYSDLGMSKEEMFVLRILDATAGEKLDNFSLFAVSRWLTAPELKAGFSSGRVQFAAEHGLSREEIKLGQEVEKIFKAAFQESGLDYKREIQGYWPHLRRWIEEGFVPDKGALSRMLPKETVDWSAARIRTGEIDVYETDPILAAYKHVNGLFMKRHFDPVLPRIRANLRDIRGRGHDRTYRILNEYVQEIMGRPHTSFGRVNRALAEALEATGHTAPKRFAETIINGFVGLGYAATIPFRPALILRNYWQMEQMIPPRIGHRWFWTGLNRALTKEGFREAVEAGAVPVDVVPVFASTETLFTAPKALRGLPLRFKRAIDRGFDWYRKADDIGRAAAFHGAKARVRHYLPKYMKGEMSYERFKELSKIKTFDRIQETRFDEMFKAGRLEEALDELGVQLSREAHFRYGDSNHPAGWGSIYGRLFGQFGTWPVQYKDFLAQGAARGTTKDKVEFFMTHITSNLALAGAGAAVGLNLWSWVAFPSLNYTGGPFADMAIDMVKAVNGSPAERAMARRSLLFQFPTLEDPQSIFVPGSYLLGDIHDALNVEDTKVFRTVLEAGGFRIFEPGEKTGLDWLLE